MYALVTNKIMSTVTYINALIHLSYSEGQLALTNTAFIEKIAVTLGDHMARLHLSMECTYPRCSETVMSLVLLGMAQSSLLGTSQLGVAKGCIYLSILHNGGVKN